MTSQSEFNLSERKTRKRIGCEAARKMIAILAVRNKWTTRREIMDTYGWKDSRLCRLGCESAHGRIIFSQKGYTLLANATIEEIGECTATIISQINALQEKHAQITRRYHAQNTMQRIEKSA